MRKSVMSKAVFNADDPLLLSDQLTEDERMVRFQEVLRQIALRDYHSRVVWGRRTRLRSIRPGCTRGRAS